MSPDRHARTMLPIPDRPAPGLTTYDAKDPETSFPPIEPLLPPEGRSGAYGVRLRRWWAGQRRRRHALLRRDAVGTGRVENTQPMVFSGDETTDIGQETGTTVSPEYTARDSRFSGKINWVQIDLGADDHDHFIDPEERLRLAMAKQ